MVGGFELAPFLADRPAVRSPLPESLTWPKLPAVNRLIVKSPTVPMRVVVVLIRDVRLSGLPVEESTQDFRCVEVEDEKASVQSTAAWVPCVYFRSSWHVVVQLGGQPRQAERLVRQVSFVEAASPGVPETREAQFSHAWASTVR